MTCSRASQCGYTPTKETEQIRGDETKHDWEEKTRREEPKNCTTSGIIYHYKECKNCQSTEDDPSKTEIIPPLDHKYTTQTVRHLVQDSTCKIAGTEVNYKVCDVCKKAETCDDCKEFEKALEEAGDHVITTEHDEHLKNKHGTLFPLDLKEARRHGSVGAGLQDRDSRQAGERRSTLLRVQ